MVDWSSITVAIIGSSLIGFILTNGLIDYSQPKIRISVDKPFENSTQKRYDTSVVNEGLSAATNLRILLHYPSGNITNYRLVLEGENSTSVIDPKAQSTLVITVPRFAQYGVLLINTIVNDTKAPYYVDRDDIEYRGNYSKYGGSYFISATYDQGGTQVSTDYSQRAYRPLESIVPFSLLIISIVVIALIVLVSIIIYGIVNKKRLPQVNKRLITIITIADAVLIIAILFFTFPGQFPSILKT